LPALIVLVIVQVIQDMFLVPKIMGRTTGLKPAIILLSLFVWGALLGLVGMIIALPMTTLLISYYKRFILCESECESIIVVNEQGRKREMEKRGKKVKEKKEDDDKTNN
jgi:predicted PurR-regulated permease PerM